MGIGRCKGNHEVAFQLSIRGVEDQAAVALAWSRQLDDPATCPQEAKRVADPTWRHVDAQDRLKALPRLAVAGDAVLLERGPRGRAMRQVGKTANAADQMDWPC